MATSPAQQILSSAVDAAGLSTTTAIPSPTDPRPGQVYDPVNLAAAAPIYFVPTTSPSLGGTNFLMLNSQRWTAATASGSHPGAYTDFTSSYSPSWVHVNAATGVSTVINAGYEIPMKTVNESRTLTSAVSRGNQMFWTLNSVVQGEETLAVVQHWHNNTAINTINLQGEEVIPTAANEDDDDTVIFSQGLQWDTGTGTYLHAYGTGSSTGQVYAVRKGWARAGHTGTPTNPLDTQWEFYTGTGWGADSSSAKPLMTAAGPMTSAGPLSFGHYGMQKAAVGMSRGKTAYTLASTVVDTSGEMSAQLYSSLGGRPWQPFGSPIALGTSGSSYTGGTLQLQPQVGCNSSMIDAATSASAIPYCYSTISESGGASSLEVNWGLLQIPRLS